MDATSVLQTFQDLGARCLIDKADFVRKIERIKAFIFDWDGVFNTGIKAPEAPSNFSEPDSMGLNLLRYGSWFRQYRQLPPTAILTGANNATAQYFAEREHLSAIYFGYKNKLEALEHFVDVHQLESHQIAFVFDDILDLSVAQQVGLRVLVPRTANPLMNKYIEQSGLADYVTAHTGGQYAIRECAELILGVWDSYETVVDSRIAFDDTYQLYWKARNQITTDFIQS